MNSDGAFELDNEAAYQAWRAEKLEAYPENIEDLVFQLSNPHQLSAAEKHAISRCCRKTNMAVYVSNSHADPDKKIAADLARQFGLRRLDNNMGADDDGITALQVQHDQWRKRYIPYTDHAIRWHTDGYYNAADQQIMALNLHCVRPAAEGGENALLDHEIAYLLLRDENPEYIEALMHAEAMTIPENIVDGHRIRGSRTGPVFSVRQNGRLHMRYTARKHNVIWRTDEATQKAVAALEKILASDSPYIYRATLQSGWGLISNNVLHDRSAFSDDEARPRLLYRLRFYDPLNLA